MVLVASETGHVYTFSTTKFKPLLNSEPGRKLIQTCLADDDKLMEMPKIEEKSQGVLVQHLTEQNFSPSTFERRPSVISGLQEVSPMSQPVQVILPFESR
jgi:hypothetical protein